jgi:hypothetical protein
VILHGDRGGSSENPFTGWDGIGLEGIFSYLNVFKDLSEGKINLCMHIFRMIQMYDLSEFVHKRMT